MTQSVLTINGGSSSVKFVLFADEDPPRRIVSGNIERIGGGDATLKAKWDNGKKLDPQKIEAPDQSHAAEELIHWLEQNADLKSVRAVGHRVVHGGPRYSQSEQVSPDVIAELQRLSHIDPMHLPGEIALIEAFAKRFPALPQIACFDTAFHHDMPRTARLLPLPLRYESQGIRRYGFHGLSYTFLMEELARLSGSAAGQAAVPSRVILAHLGSGASIAAVRDGKSIDTTMSFTPTAGLVMGTRCGDLDPGVLVYLMREEGLGAEQIDDLVNRHSGLAGLSETSADVRDLLAREATDTRAADALAVFCYEAKKWIGAYAAALGGLDTLVFAGGIGENAPEIRARICEGLDHLGIRLDPSRNAQGAGVISADGATATVRVIPTDEELMIFREVRRMLYQP